ncbi:uncharacterized protein AC631_03878 [Debaryomyces fabryi]|uniref:DNA topoisomerase (ATP-hydrolyzing) n=1 Tax=Debaryomyces fabryi TaxID=58627 RepID=A0A0V1PW90_9ASCO|nr:uncharacterized protein AC631_03878 [Debaryomyces fabryi]KSA00362.1 hypothetical protein AC631_03878 [Debaryomyces fabryi]CUM57216.1 unnamed protein product [Debaryomyces fabryi]
MRYRLPLQKLFGLWEQIRSNISGDIVIVFHKPYCRSRKITYSGSIKGYEVGQLGGSEVEARRFAAVIKVLKTMIVNLVQDRTTTKRDVYYQDVGLFQKSQPFANELIECIVGSLGMCAEKDLKIFASQKGLIFGNMRFRRMGIECELDEPVLIPRTNELEAVDPPKGIVVIEKEAVFKSFCKYIQNIDVSLIAVTGKGFPDSLTKRFVGSLGETYPKVPIMAFMDSDVYGLSICKNYKYAKNFDSVVCPKLTFAGVFLTEYASGWLDISARDWRMMSNFIRDIKLLQRPVPEEQELNKWHRELTRGLVLFKKSEMNIVDSCPNEYILRKIKQYIQ